jgi:hypothetical protein
MTSDEPHLRDSYSRMSEPELFELARTYDTLTDTAQSALRTEFALRNLLPPLVDEPEYPTSSNLVTVRRYRDLSEGIVARSLLQSLGLRAELRDENLIRLDWQISNFIGGLRLQVPAADAATAEELLSQPVIDPIPMNETADPDSDPDEYVQPRCPHCGSNEISFEGHSRAAALTSLYVLSLPLPPGPETWLCHACGTRWQDLQEPEEDEPRS